MGNLFSPGSRPSRQDIRSHLNGSREHIILRRARLINFCFAELIQSVVSKPLKKLNLEGSLKNPHALLEVLQALGRNEEIKDLYLSLSYNKCDEESIEKLVEQIKSGKIKSLSIPEGVKASEVNKMLQGVLDRRGKMGMLDLGDCELDDDSIELLKKIIEKEKVTKRFDLRHCTGTPGENGEKRLLSQECRKTLKTAFKKTHIITSPIEMFSRFKLFEAEENFSTSCSDVPLHELTIKRTFYNQLWIKEDTGEILSVFFKQIKDLLEAPYISLQYRVLQSTHVVLELEGHEKLEIGIECLSPKGLTYKLACEDPAKFSIAHKLVKSKKRFSEIKFLPHGEIPDGDQLLELKYNITEFDQIKHSYKVTCPFKKSVNRLDTGVQTDVKHKFYCQLWARECTGELSFVLFKEIEDLEKNQKIGYNELEYKKLLLTNIVLELEEHEEFTIGIQSLDPASINYESGNGNPARVILEHTMICDAYSINFVRRGVIPETSSRIELKCSICVPNDEDKNTIFRHSLRNSRDVPPNVNSGTQPVIINIGDGVTAYSYERNKHVAFEARRGATIQQKGSVEATFGEPRTFGGQGHRLRTPSATSDERG